MDDGPLLRIDGLTKRYPGVTALDDLTVEVPRGRIGLVGANGAGKTTTFRLLLGLAHPTEGRVEVCGIDVAHDPIGVRARLGYMPEHDCLPLDQTAADVVSTFGELSGLPARAARQRASDILDLVGLDEARFRPISGFSTGMRQRTKLAQALVGDPELVLLDEPTAGLDPLGREEMLALVARLGTFGISVLMATHLLDDVQQVCDHVVMIDGGKLVVSGTTDSLLERTGIVTVDVGPRGSELVGGLMNSRLERRRRRGIGRGDRRGRRRHGQVARRHRRARASALPPLDAADVARRGVPEARREPVVSAIETGGQGAVYDRGYRPYDGPRGRRGAATYALYKASMRRALGIRRSWRQKVAPFTLLAVVTIPAIVNVGIGYVTRDRLQDRIEIITYRDYVGVSSALLLFVALVAPDVMCPDRRQRVLPLMFARPLMGTDYVAAKVGAIGSILFAFSFVPQVVLFVGNMLVSDSALDYLTGHLDVLWKVPVAVVLLAVYYAVIGVAIASLTDRRIVAGAAVIGLFLITSISSGIIVGEDPEIGGGSIAALINVLALPLYLRDIIFLGHVDPQSPLTGVDNGGLYAVATYVAVLVVCLGVLLRRYRWVER